MTLFSKLFHRKSREQEPLPPLAPGVESSSNSQYDACLSRAVELADRAEALAAAGDGEAFYRLLTGKGDCLCERTPGSGHNLSAVLEAMHIYHSTHEGCDMAARFTGAMYCMNKHLDSRDAANVAFSYIGLQLKRVANENAVFDVNSQQLFYDLMSAIAENREEVEDDMPFFGEWLEDRKAFIREYL